MPKRLTTEEFIKRAIAVHGDNYGYSKIIYVRYHSKVTIVCFKHGDFEITPADFLGGHGCWDCKADKTREYYKEKRKNLTA